MLTLSKNDVIGKSGIITIDRFNNCDSRIYFLTKGSEVIYVGQTMDIASRIKSHSRYKDFDGFCYIKVPVWRVNLIEAFYIVKFNPAINKSIPKNKMYQSSSKTKELLMKEASIKIDEMIEERASFSCKNSKASVKYATLGSFEDVKSEFLLMIGRSI